MVRRVPSTLIMPGAIAASASGAKRRPGGRRRRRRAAGGASRAASGRGCAGARRVEDRRAAVAAGVRATAAGGPRRRRAWPAASGLRGGQCDRRSSAAPPGLRCAGRGASVGPRRAAASGASAPRRAGRTSRPRRRASAAPCPRPAPASGGGETSTTVVPRRFSSLQRPQISACLGVAVEVGVGLVQHDQLGLAEHGARQADQLALAARQVLPALADLGVVALAAGAGSSRGSRRASRRRRPSSGSASPMRAMFAKHRAVEQLDVLRQVADMAAEILAHPGEDVGAVEADRAGRRLQRADQQADQRGLAGRRGADDGQALARRRGRRTRP